MLYHLRTRAHLSQMQLAVALGIGLKKVVSMEKSFESQRLSELRVVAGYFSLSLGELLAGCIEKTEKFDANQT